MASNPCSAMRADSAAKSFWRVCSRCSCNEPPMILGMVTSSHVLSRKRRRGEADLVRRPPAARRAAANRPESTPARRAQIRRSFVHFDQRTAASNAVAVPSPGSTLDDVVDGRQMTELADPAHVSAAHERFVTTGRAPGRHVRPVVADSWRRSRRSGVDPEVQHVPVDMVGRSLTSYRGGLPVAAAMPVIRELLVAPGADAGWITTLTDDTGRLLWVEGDHAVRRQMEGVAFVEGSVWREDCAGTNALGTALAIDQPMQVVGYE